MIITVEIKTCIECRHIDHSGAFTPGGSRLCCHLGSVNVPCVDRKTGKKLKDKCNDVSHWWCRELNNDLSIPEWCALKHGARY